MPKANESTVDFKTAIISQGVIDAVEVLQHENNSEIRELTDFLNEVEGIFVSNHIGVKKMGEDEFSNKIFTFCRLRELLTNFKAE